MKQTLAKILRNIGESLALALLILFLLRVIDAKFPFLNNVEVLAKIVSYSLTYGFLLLAAIIAVAAVLEKSWLLALFVLLIVAVIVVFTFFPGVLAQIGI